MGIATVQVTFDTPHGQDTRIQIRQILAAVDLDEGAEPVLAIAARLANCCGADITALHAEYYPTDRCFVADDYDCLAAIRRARQYVDEQYLHQLAERVRPGDGVETRMEVGSPVDTIIAVADESRADLIVVGTHARTGWSRRLRGSVAEEVLRRATQPVLTIPYLASSHLERYVSARRIVYAASDALSTPEAERYAFGLADRLGATVTVATPGDSARSGRPRRLADFVPSERAPHRFRLAMGAGVWSDWLLQRIEEEQPDLVVVGSDKGTRALSAPHIQIVRGAPCPVLTVPETAHTEKGE